MNLQSRSRRPHSLSKQCRQERYTHNNLSHTRTFNFFQKKQQHTQHKREGEKKKKGEKRRRKYRPDSHQITRSLGAREREKGKKEKKGENQSREYTSLSEITAWFPITVYSSPAAAWTLILSPQSPPPRPCPVSRHRRHRNPPRPPLPQHLPRSPRYPGSR